MTLSEIVERVADKLGYQREEIWIIAEEIFEEISNSLAQGSDVKVRGFGTFLWLHRKAKNVRHPITKEIIRTPESLTLRFRAADRIRSRNG